MLLRSCCARGQLERDARAFALLDGEASAQRPRALCERVEELAAALLGAVVLDRRDEAPVRLAHHAHADPRGRPAPHGAVQRLADDLVERRLHLLAERLGRRDVHLDLDLPLEPERVRERRDGRADALVAQHDRLEVEREVAERADGVALARERVGEDLARRLEVALLDRVSDGVEHQRDPGERLHGAVVEEERDPAALVLLRGDQAFREPVELAAGLSAQSMIASRSAIATACVRVSASSFARMWRTWLFTVSWLMKSFVATSAFDIPSARSWRISRSRVVSMSSLPLPVRNAGMSAGSTYTSPL